MKQLCFSILLLAVILLTDSCKKVVMSNWSNLKVTFKVDGMAKQASGNTKVFANLIESQNNLQIIGNLEDGEGVSLMLNDFKGIGEYDAEGSLLGLYVSELSLRGQFVAITGKVKVTSWTETSVKGEFEFLGQNGYEEKKIITEGKFESKVFKM